MFDMKKKNPCFASNRVSSVYRNLKPTGCDLKDRSMFERIQLIFTKELTDHIRDRRTLMTSLFYPLLGPLMLILLFTVIGQTVATRAEQPLDLPVAGAEHAPALVEFLRQNNARVQPAPANPQAAVSAGDADVVLVIPPHYADDFRAGRPATV